MAVLDEEADWREVEEYLAVIALEYGNEQPIHEPRTRIDNYLGDK